MNEAIINDEQMSPSHPKSGLFSRQENSFQNQDFTSDNSGAADVNASSEMACSSHHNDFNTQFMKQDLIIQEQNSQFFGHEKMKQSQLNIAQMTKSARLKHNQTSEQKDMVLQNRRMGGALRQMSNSKNKKYKQMQDDMSQLRYTLIYFDDLLLNVLSVKRQLTYCRPQMDEADVNYSYCHQVEDIKIDNERYKNKLRTEEGLYFDFNVQASPGRKLDHASTVKRTALKVDSIFKNMSPQVNRQSKNTSGFIDICLKQKEVLRTRSIKRESDSQIRELDMHLNEDISSLNGDAGDQPHSNKASVHQIPKPNKSQQHSSSLSCHNLNQDNSSRLANESDCLIASNSKLCRQSQTLSKFKDCNEIKLFKPILRCSSQTFSRQIMNSSQSYKQLVEDTAIQNIVNTRHLDSDYDRSDLEEDNQISPEDDYQNLRDFEDYLFENYTSPTVVELCKQKRLNEIKKIDENCENLKQLLRIQKQNQHNINCTLDSIAEAQLNQSDEPKHPNDQQKIEENSPAKIFRQQTLKKEVFRHFSSPRVNQIVKKLSKRKLQKLISMSPQAQTKGAGQSSFKMGLLKNIQLMNSANTSARNHYSSHLSDQDHGQQDLNFSKVGKKLNQIDYQPIDQSITQCEKQANQTEQRDNDICFTKSQQLKLSSMKIVKQVSFIDNDKINQQEEDDSETSQDEAAQDQQIYEVDNEHEFEDLMSIDIKHIEPNSAKLKRSPKQNQPKIYTNGRRQTQIIGPKKLLDKKRKLSNFTGQSQTGSDDDEDCQNSSRQSSSSESYDIYGNKRFISSKFQDFRNMQNLRKCIFTRKRHDKTCLALKQKVKIHQNDMPHLVKSVSHVDLGQMMENYNKSKLSWHGNERTRQNDIQKLREDFKGPIKHIFDSIQIQRSNGTDSNEDQDFQGESDSNQLIQSLQINAQELMKIPKLNNINSTLVKSMNIKMDCTKNSFHQRPTVTKRKTVISQNKSKHNRNSKSNTKRNSSKLESANDRKYTSEQKQSKKLRSNKVNEVESRNLKKERKRNIKRLMMSTHNQKEGDFLENQKNQLDWLQKLSETLKGMQNLRPAYEDLYPESPKNQVEIVEEDEKSKDVSRESQHQEDKSSSYLRSSNDQQLEKKPSSKMDANCVIDEIKSSSKDSIESDDDINRLVLQAKQLKLNKSKSHAHNQSQTKLNIECKQRNNQVAQNNKSLRKGLVKLQSKSLQQIFQNYEIAKKDLQNQINTQYNKINGHHKQNYNQSAQMNENPQVAIASSQGSSSISNQIKSIQQRNQLNQTFAQTLQQPKQKFDKSIQRSDQQLKNTGINQLNKQYDNAFEGKITIQMAPQHLYLSNQATHSYSSNKNLLRSQQLASSKIIGGNKFGELSIYQCNSVPVNQKQQISSGFDSSFAKVFKKNLKEISKQLNAKVRKNTNTRFRASSVQNQSKAAKVNSKQKQGRQADCRQQKLEAIKEMFMKQSYNFRLNNQEIINTAINTKQRRQTYSTQEYQLQEKPQTKFKDLLQSDLNNQQANSGVRSKPVLSIKIDKVNLNQKKKSSSLNGQNRDSQQREIFDPDNLMRSGDIKSKFYLNDIENNISIEEDSILTPEDRVMVSGPSSIGNSPLSSLKPSPDGQKLFQIFMQPNQLKQAIPHEVPQQEMTNDCDNQYQKPSKQTTVQSNHIEPKDNNHFKRQQVTLKNQFQLEYTDSQSEYKPGFSQNNNLFAPYGSVRSSSGKCINMGQDFKVQDSLQLNKLHKNNYQNSLTKLTTKSPINKWNHIQMTDKSIQNHLDNYNQKMTSRNQLMTYKKQHLTSQRSQLSQPKSWKEIRTQLDEQRLRDRHNKESQLNLGKQLTESIRHTIDRDLDSLQLIFSKKKRNQSPLMSFTGSNCNQMDQRVSANADTMNQAQREVPARQTYKHHQIPKLHRTEPAM